MTRLPRPPIAPVHVDCASCWHWRAVALLVAGCEKPEGVAHYTVAKPVPLDPLPAKADPHAGLNLPPKAKPTGEPTDRMLGAIVPRGDQLWFFKLLGPKDPVAAQTRGFHGGIEIHSLLGRRQARVDAPRRLGGASGPSPRFATLLDSLGRQAAGDDRQRAAQLERRF